MTSLSLAVDIFIADNTVEEGVMVVGMDGSVRSMALLGLATLVYPPEKVYAILLPYSHEDWGLWGAKAWASMQKLGVHHFEFSVREASDAVATFARGFLLQASREDQAMLLDAIVSRTRESVILTAAEGLRTQLSGVDVKIAWPDLKELGIVLYMDWVALLEELVNRGVFLSMEVENLATYL